jgi:lysophospholipase L1-like esterase
MKESATVLVKANIFKAARYVLGLLFISLAVAHSAMAHSAMAQAAPLVVWGDSLSLGTGMALEGLGRPVDNLGIKGWGLTHRNWQERVAQLQVASRTAAAVVIWVGTNDRPVADYGERLQATRRAVGDRRLVWLLPPQGCFGRALPSATSLGALVRAAARSEDAVLTADTCDTALRAGDGVHYTAQGYRRIAERVVRAIDAERGN